MAKSSLMIELDDPRAGQIAEVLTNESCKKILSALAEREMSESEISESLNLPLNTVGYNIKKLSSAGFIESGGKSFWSTRGRKIKTYRVSNKKIVISPIKKLRGVLPVLGIAAGLAFIIQAFGFYNSRNLDSVFVPNYELASMKAAAGSSLVASEVSNGGSFFSFVAGNVTNPDNVATWFFLGALTALFILLVWNRRKLQ